jgi:hypothetical protein
VKRIFCILSLAVLAACGPESKNRPNNLLPEEKMVQILADVHIAEARIETNVIYPDTALMIFNREQKRILERYGVDEEQFRETYRYYLNNIRQMDRLYETILDTLSVREARHRVSDTTNVEHFRQIEPSRSPRPTPEERMQAN